MYVVQDLVLIFSDKMVALIIYEYRLVSRGEAKRREKTRKI